MKILVTGCAGFIGFHLTLRLLSLGNEVIGVDNLNDYYDPHLKQNRLLELEKSHFAENFKFNRLDLADQKNLEQLFEKERVNQVINLAGQAGVRYSLINPQSYITSNLTGFGNILECCRKYPIQHLVFASSSSVYGLNENWPFSEHNGADHPASLYAATKRSNELMAHSYSHLFSIPATGLRFFTVYGPWGRPDMALYLFTRAILSGTPINVFNNGNLQRDFTYIDDIVTGIREVLARPPKANATYDAAHPDPATSSAPWAIFNIGNNHTVSLEEFIETIEHAVGKKAIRNYQPMQPGDVKSTLADVSSLKKATGFAPTTPLKTGIEKYIEWYRQYYG